MNVFVAIAAAVVGACAAFGAGALVLRVRVKVPLGLVSEAARRYREGKLDTSLQIERGGPVEQIAKDLSAMAESLKRRIDILTRQRNEQTAILSGMVEAVIVLNTSLEVIEANPAASELMRIPSEEAIGHSLIDVIRNTELHTFAQETLEGSAPRETSITMSGPQSRYLQVHGNVLRRDDGAAPAESPERIVLVLHDITKIKNLENIRRDFVANVSHELKTPVTAIKGFIETLKEGAMADRQTATRFLDIIAKQSDRMEAIIEDLLSLSRLEQSDGRPMESTRFSLRAAVDSAVDMCSEPARRKNISIAVACDERVTLCGNPHLIEQAIVNLVDNAVKYSPMGATVDVGGAETETHTDIVVRDHGIGIPQKELPRIFERFYRVDKARSRELGGTGLGLAIVKHIAMTHRGEVLVESVLGSGSTFTLRLPRERAEA